jgi:hypothetical protein
VEWYRHIALAEEELRREFEYMHARHSTPEEYGLRVRTHPGGMTVSALNKLFHTRKQQLSWEGQLVQTWALPKYPDMARHNLERTNALCATLGSPNQNSQEKGYLWKNVGVEQVANYLESLRFPAESARASGRFVAEYIRKQNGRGTGELSDWTVVLVSKTQDQEPGGNELRIAGYPIVRLKRKVTDSVTSWDVTKANLLSPEDESRDFEEQVFDSDWFRQIADKPELADDLEFLQQRAELTCDAKQVAKELTSRWQHTEPPKIRGGGGGTAVAERANGRILRLLRPRTRGLLLIYPMVLRTSAEETETPAANPAKPMIGVAVSLPASHNASGVEYVVGKVWDAQQLAELNDEE